MIQAIISYESGEMSQDETIQFFAELVMTGFINAMQGHYQRTAQNLIEHGFISEDGEVNQELTQWVTTLEKLWVD